MTSESITSPVEAEYAALHQKFGAVMTLDMLANCLHYPSIAAIRMAHARGTLPVPLYRFEKRAGLYAKSIDVAKCIAEMHVVPVGRGALGRVIYKEESDVKT